MNKYPTSIKQISKEKLQIIWSDGHISEYELKRLREECPCATCNGEQVLWRHYGPTRPINIITHNMIELKGIQPVGNYAIQLIWKDGHDTGIYSWEYLLKLCDCEICQNNRQGE